MSSHREISTPVLITVDGVAELLSVTPSAVRQMVARRQIPFVRLGAKRLRFDPVEIQAWIEGQRVPAS